MNSLIFKQQASHYFSAMKVSTKACSTPALQHCRNNSQLASFRRLPVALTTLHRHCYRHGRGLNRRCLQCWADDNSSSSDVYPAALKLVIRYHIRNLCSAQHCVDSLVVYLNSPTTSDGTMLLWDVDHDGLVSSHTTASPARQAVC